MPNAPSRYTMAAISPEPMTINPIPQLKYIFSLRCKIGPTINVGEGPYGLRACVPITGGTFTGRFGLNGTILNGGADNMIVVDEIRTRIDTRYMLQTDDGAYIYIRTTGGRAGTSRMVDELYAGVPQVKDDWKSVLSVVLETGHEKFHWLNDHTIVARMANIDGDICYDAYLIDAYGELDERGAVSEEMELGRSDSWSALQN